MSARSHREFLERSAREAALRARENSARRFLAPDEVGRLTIQTVEPWKRVVLVLAGLGIAGLGVALGIGGAIVGGVIVGTLGLLLVLFGLRGRRRHIEAVINSADLLEIVNIFDW